MQTCQHHDRQRTTIETKTNGKPNRPNRAGPHIHGQFMASAWPVHGKFMASSWPVHGQFMA
eukprot:7988012-Lingulodinium_polyedra.AAC.1